jgi:hypothetical protein
VTELKHQIRHAADVVVATPEYNFSIPCGLEHWNDWLSRGAGQPFLHEPVALLSAATGPLGGARVQRSAQGAAVRECAGAAEARNLHRRGSSLWSGCRLWGAGSSVSNAGGRPERGPCGKSVQEFRRPVLESVRCFLLERISQ